MSRRRKDYNKLNNAEKRRKRKKFFFVLIAFLQLYMYSLEI
ncbi:hypothetical protein FVB9288_02284 [Flavobacterium sp. CECT 9288]|nr:hypothetical protein FVB9288_02284 [Flavobacterium sp. CECT 9288]